MIFLEGVIVNALIIVLCMYVDRYILDDYCRQRPVLDKIFKGWIIVTAISVFYALLKALSKVEVLAI